jgi:hypothetical protein
LPIGAVGGKFRCIEPREPITPSLERSQLAGFVAKTFPVLWSPNSINSAKGGVAEGVTRHRGSSELADYPS